MQPPTYVFRSLTIADQIRQNLTLQWQNDRKYRIATKKKRFC